MMCKKPRDMTKKITNSWDSFFFYGFFARLCRLFPRCQQILTETDNLYSVRYQSKGQGDEGEALEEQFFQIYADRQFLRLPTRVRFGEVTGIQFDASAATQDISRSGQLGTPEALRSFGLLHLHDPVKKLFVIDHAPVPEMVSLSSRALYLVVMYVCTQYEKVPTSIVK